MSTNLDLYSTRQAVNKLAQDGISLETGDIEIGAVELKDGTTDNRVSISEDGALKVSSQSIPTNPEYKSPDDFSAAYTSSTTITLSGTPYSVVSANLLYIKVTNSSGETTYYVNGSNGVSMTISSNVITISGAGTPFASGDVYEVGLSGQNKAYDSSTNSQMNSVLNPEYSHYTSPEQLVTASDIGASDGVYVDQGAEINMEGYDTLGMFVKFTANSSTTNTIKVLAKHESGGAEEFVLETSSDYIKTLGDSNINIYYEFNTNGTIPYLQIQSAAGTVGATPGTLEINIVKK